MADLEARVRELEARVLELSEREAIRDLRFRYHECINEARMADIPDLFNSPLTQFHVHNNICFAETSDPLQKVFAGLTDSNGNCPTGTELAGNVPMLHVWIEKNPCGPFAALSGIAAGQVPPGETPNCDTATGERERQSLLAVAPPEGETNEGGVSCNLSGSGFVGWTCIRPW